VTRARAVPTPLLAHGERPRIAIAEAANGGFFRALWVLWRLALFTLRLAALKISGRLTAQRAGAEAERFCRRLGVLWIKVGQLFSMRSDLFPRELCAELAKLQAAADGFSPELAMATVARELGAPIETLFAHFEREPAAAASIAQVHRAVLRKERVAVAVKVRRPNAARLFAKDLGLIRRLAQLCERLSIAPFMRWTDMMWEIENVVAEELDYRFEMTNQRRLRRTLKAHGILVPKVFPERSTEQVLTMEWFDGVFMADYLEMAARDPDRLARWRAENNIDPERVGKRLLFSFLRQLLEDRLFHADLHPGNLILLRDSRLAFVDFGSVGAMEGDMWRKYDAYLKALTEGEYAKAVDVFMLLAPSVPSGGVSAVKEEMVRRLQFWGSRARVADLPYELKSANAVVQEMARALAKHGVDVTWSLLRILRGWATMDASLRVLIPKANLPDLMREFSKQRRRRVMKRLARGAVEDMGRWQRLIDYPKRRFEETMFRGAVLRRVAQAFEGVATRVSRLLASLFGLGVGIGAAAGIYAMIACARQMLGALGWIDADPAALWLTGWPALDWQVWILVFVLCQRVVRLMTSLRRRFLEKEAHFAS